MKTGFSFGLASGVITTLGLIVGLYSGTRSKLAVAGGIFTIAIADAFSDALGIHISQESQNKYSKIAIWEATFATLLSKFIFASSFIWPILFLELNLAIIVSIVWGLLILSVYNFIITKQKGSSPWKLVLEHLIIGLLVILVTRLVGEQVVGVFSRKP